MSLKDFDDFVNKQNKPLIVIDFTTAGGHSATDDIVDSSFLQGTPIEYSWSKYRFILLARSSNDFQSYKLHNW